LNPQSEKPFIAESLLGASQRVSAAEYADNVRELVRSARRRRARVIVMEPPVNLYTPPFASQRLPGGERWERWCRDAAKLVDAGSIDAAMNAVEAELKTQPRNVYALWMKGYAMTKAGRIREGREFLEQALEAHPFPESCRRSYREVLSAVAGEERADYLPVNELFLASGLKEGAPSRLYLDHCHPTPAGHRLIAMALRELIVPEGGALSPPGVGADGTTPDRIRPGSAGIRQTAATRMPCG